MDVKRIKRDILNRSMPSGDRSRLIELLIAIAIVRAIGVLIRAIAWTGDEFVPRWSTDYEVSPVVLWVGIGSFVALSMISAVGLWLRALWGWFITATYLSIACLRASLAIADFTLNKSLHDPITFFSWGNLRYREEETIAIAIFDVVIFGFLFSESVFKPFGGDVVHRPMYFMIVIGATLSWYVMMKTLAGLL